MVGFGSKAFLRGMAGVDRGATRPDEGSHPWGRDSVVTLAGPGGGLSTRWSRATRVRVCLLVWVEFRVRTPDPGPWPPAGGRCRSVSAADGPAGHRAFSCLPRTHSHVPPDRRDLADKDIAPGSCRAAGDLPHGWRGSFSSSRHRRTQHNGQPIHPGGVVEIWFLAPTRTPICHCEGTLLRIGRQREAGNVRRATDSPNDRIRVFDPTRGHLTTGLPSP
jgi:hypothetical protein